MKSMFGMCFNRKVLVGLAAIAIGLFVFAPGQAVAALPLLLLAACPLSMIFMMRMMGGSHDHTTEGHFVPGATKEPLQERLHALREEERRLESQLRASETEALTRAIDKVRN